jgi:hypothetical protein
MHRLRYNSQPNTEACLPLRRAEVSVRIAPITEVRVYHLPCKSTMYSWLAVTRAILPMVDRMFLFMLDQSSCAVANDNAAWLGSQETNQKPTYGSVLQLVAPNKTCGVFSLEVVEHQHRIVSI